jgi:glutamine cyclotransferase
MSLDRFCVRVPLVGIVRLPSPTRRSMKKLTPTAVQAARPRSSSVTMLGARKKRDVAKEIWRLLHHIPSWPAPLKVVLFVVLFFALWFCFFFQAPSLPRTAPLHSPANKSTTSKYVASSGISTAGTRPASTTPDLSAPPTVTPQVLARLPHDSNAFTQGLVIHQGEFYESTGLYGQSTVRRVEVATGQVQETWALPVREFGEGLCLFEDQLIQITWREHTGYVYSRANFTAGPIRTFQYPMDGWGITHDGENLLMTDGSSTVYYLDPSTYAVTRRLKVQWAKNKKLHEVRNLNELEFVDGMIYANIWMTNFIIIIDPATGLVRKAIDCTALHPSPTNQEMTLNGIAFDEQERRLYITGKLWPTIFEIEYIGVDAKR